MRLGRCQHNRHVRLRNRRRRLIRENRLFGARLELAIRLDKGQPQSTSYLGLGRPYQRQIPICLRRNRQPIRIDLNLGGPVPRPEHQHPITLDRVKPICQHKRLQLLARSVRIVWRIPTNNTVQTRHVTIRDASFGTNVQNHGPKRATRRAPIQPMPTQIVFAVAP